MTRRHLLVALAGVAAVAALSGCGRKGSLIEPEGITYPRPYPSIPYPGDAPAVAPAPAGSPHQGASSLPADPDSSK